MAIGWIAVQIGAAGLGLAINTACEPEDPCDRYVDYMCDCHDGDEGSCSDYEATYLGAQAQIQAECDVLLDEQQERDGSDGFDCGT